MAENSKIEWATHTFNPWVGCTKVSPACDHCYAEAWAKRTGQSALWAGERRRTSAAYWQQPLKWNRQAERDGTRPRVFCASLADVFDNQAPEEWRNDLWRLIAATPHLDWLLLTKRPQNIRKFIDGAALPNVWLGTTVENQTEADCRIPHLLAVRAAVRFLSCEPLLGPVDLTAHFLNPHGFTETPRWVITGGESGPGARPSHPDWLRNLRDQCAEAEVPFFFKQHGEWVDAHGEGYASWCRVGEHTGETLGRVSEYRGRGIAGLEGRDWPSQWPFPKPPDPGPVMIRIGKKAAGRLLDGVEHNGAPGHD